MSRIITRTAFTLIEVLAAVVILGLLAAALVPLQLRATARQTRTQDVVAAQAAIAAHMHDAAFRLEAGQTAVSDHPDWTLQVEMISPESGVSNPELLGRRWYRIVIRRRGENAVIADGAKIFPNVFVGNNVIVGQNTILHPGVKIYHHCKFK